MTSKEKRSCRAETAKLIRHGDLKTTPCEVCGDPKVQVHHLDYADPKNVRFLCKKHHNALHGKFGQSAGIEQHTISISVKSRDMLRQIAHANGRSMTKEFERIANRAYSKLQKVEARR